MSHDQALKAALAKENIEQDVIKQSFTTEGSLTIEYSPEAKVELGNSLTQEETQQMPDVKYNLHKGVSELDALYTLTMTDPDAPDRADPTWGEYCHYIESNITLTHKGEIKNGDILAKYVGPAPRVGNHRYVFILYKQNPKVKPAPIKENKHWGYGQQGTGVHRWALENELKVVAVNYFMCAAYPQ